MNNDYSLADIALATGNTGNNSSSMWGDDGAWWIIIFLIFAMFGWGGNGWGGNGASGGATPFSTSVVTQSDLQRGFDTQSIVGKLDGLANGLCDSTYALSNAINSGFSNAELARCNSQSAIMQQLYNMASANQLCCCETNNAITSNFANLNYNIASQCCDLKTQIANSTRDIIDNANINNRAILDYLTSEKISSLQTELALAQGQLSQNVQTRTLVEALRPPMPVPAFVVANPFTPPTTTTPTTT